MTVLKLSKAEKEAIVNTNHRTPRSVLGFHEVLKADKTPVWVIRTLEPEAKAVWLLWEDQSEAEAVPLKCIHKQGLFELCLAPLPSLKPYRLKIQYHNGNEFIRHDPYYFSPQLTEFDRYLFNSSVHHHIYRKLGAHILCQDGIQGTLFAVWAPNAQRVSVVGDFNQWDGRKYAMQSHEQSGIWELFVPDVGEGTVYKYELKGPDGSVFLKSDPYGFYMERRPNTASIVTQLEGYEWQDTEWLTQRAANDIFEQPINIYEVHLGSWRRSPDDPEAFLDYRTLADQLIEYVTEMGYTHIELMPLAEHPLDDSWGYQVTGYYAATSRYGKPHDLMYLIDRCHQAGIGVIMDWVPGHFPKDAHGLAYFDGTALYEHADPRQGEHRDWGTKIFNYGRHEVRNFLIANALFWLEYYHIDGFRVDAVASMLYLDYSREHGEWIPNQYGGNENLDAIDFLRQLHETLFHYYPNILAIAEESTAWSKVSFPTYIGGLGFNMKWNMGWMNDTLRYIGLDPVYRKYEHHLITFSLMYAFSEHFILPISHDEVVHGKGALLSKMPGDDWQKRANFRLYLCFQMAHPGKKLLFMGSEFGQWSEWQCHHSLDWHLLEQPEHQQLQTCVRELNHFYRDQPVLYTNDFDWSGFQWRELNDTENSVISFLRRGNNKVSSSHNSPLIFIFNCTPVPRDKYTVGVPRTGTYEKVFDTDASEYGGSGYNQQTLIDAEDTPWQGQPAALSVELPPLGCLVLQRKNEF